MKQAHTYNPYQQVVLAVLLSGFVVQPDADEQIWQIAWSEKQLDNLDPIIWLGGLEKNSMIKTESSNVSARLLYVSELKNIAAYKNKDELANIVFHDKSIESYEKKVQPYKRFCDLVQSQRLDMLDGMQYSFMAIDRAGLLDGFYNYLESFTEDRVHFNRSVEPWSWKHQKSYAMNLINNKNRIHEKEITISNADISLDAVDGFRLLETLLALAKDSIIVINYLGIDYGYKKQEFEHLPIPGILFARISLKINDSSFPKNYATLEKPDAGVPISFTPESYDSRKGKLYVKQLGFVKISSNGNSYRPPDKLTGKKTGEMYEQCYVMARLFKNVNTLNQGVTISQAIGVSDKYMTTQHLKRIKNIVSEINRKAKEEAGIKKLIVITGKKVKVNNSYLLKD